MICTSYSKALQEIYFQLLGVDSELNPEYFLKKAHVNLLFYQKNRQMIADATADPDLVRVKMGLSTLGYQPVNNFLDISEELSNQDQVIGYQKGDYQDVVLKHQIQAFLNENRVDYWKVMKLDDAMVKKIQFLKELYELYCTKFRHFSDAVTCLSILRRELLDKSEKRKVHNTSLFQNESDDVWNFLHIYTISLSQENIYYALQQKGKNFIFDEMKREDVFHYVNQMNGKNKENIRRI